MRAAVPAGYGSRLVLLRHAVVPQTTESGTMGVLYIDKAPKLGVSQSFCIFLISSAVAGIAEPGSSPGESAHPSEMFTPSLLLLDGLPSSL